MNMHVPQSIVAATELKYLASVLRQIISPRTNSPIIQIFQDTLTGSFRISQPDVKVPEHIAMNILSRTKRPLSSYSRKEMNMTGQELISFLEGLLAMLWTAFSTSSTTTLDRTGAASSSMKSRTL